MKHIIKSDQFTKDNIESLFDLANKFKSSPIQENLKNKLIGTLFYEPSTRTRWSFETAILKLGGQIVSMEMANNSSSSKKGESLKDTLKVCSQYVDALIVRHPENGVIEQAAEYADCPVINAGSGSQEHPTQALIDLYTISNEIGITSDLKIMFTGDLNNSRTIKSLLKLIKNYNFKILANPSSGLACNFHYPGSVSYYYDKEIYHQLPDIDILYMTRHQSERDNAKGNFTFKINYELAETMKKYAIIMHPLPRNEEIDPSTDANPRAVYFKQVKNGLWIRMALLYQILNNN